MTPAKQGGLDLYQFENHLNQKREKVDEYFDEIIAPLTENTRKKIFWERGNFRKYTDEIFFVGWEDSEVTVYSRLAMVRPFKIIISALFQNLWPLCNIVSHLEACMGTLIKQCSFDVCIRNFYFGTTKGFPQKSVSNVSQFTNQIAEYLDSFTIFKSTNKHRNFYIIIGIYLWEIIISK